MTDNDALTFPIAVNKAVIWLLGVMLSVTGGLLIWLCVSTIALRDQMSILMERTGNYKDQIQSLMTADQSQQLANARLSLEMKELQLQAAAHGWKKGE